MGGQLAAQLGPTTRLLVLDLSHADLTLNLDSEVQIDRISST